MNDFIPRSPGDLQRFAREQVARFSQTRRLPELPPPVQWLNYDGDQRGCLGQHMGPNEQGEYLTVVRVYYNEGANKTRAGLAYGLIQVVEKHRCTDLDRHTPHAWAFGVKGPERDGPVETTWFYCDGGRDAEQQPT